MIQNTEIPNKVAEYLLQIKAVKLSPKEPFTWASGLKSPIYCDNRQTLSFLEVRNYICNAFAQKVTELYGDVDVIAGVATGAIAHGVLVAQVLNKPFIYVRPDAKGHGLKNKVEGYFEENQSVVVIEDLISTGGSSLKAVQALRDVNVDVKGLLAIFTYGFDKAANNFKENNCEWHTLSNYNALIETALKTNYISNDDLELLKKWNTDPEHWLD